MFVEANIQVSWPDWQELPVTSLLCAHRQNATQPSTGVTARVSSTNVTSRMSLAALAARIHRPISRRTMHTHLRLTGSARPWPRLAAGRSNRAGPLLHVAGRGLGPAPTSDRVPGSAPHSDLLHAHKWKQGASETDETTREMRRKAKQIAPAYNKGALQYLPGGQRMSGLTGTNK